MTDLFFTQPILNSPYEYPKLHWELDKDGQPTQKIVESRRRADFITPIPKPRKRTLKACLLERWRKSGTRRQKMQGKRYRVGANPFPRFWIAFQL